MRAFFAPQRSGQVEIQAAHGPFNESFVLLSATGYEPTPETLAALDEGFSRFPSVQIISPLVIDDQDICVSAGARLVNGRVVPLYQGIPASDWHVANTCLVPTSSEDAIAVRAGAWPEIASAFAERRPLAAASRHLPGTRFGNKILYYPFARLRSAAGPAAASPPRQAPVGTTPASAKIVVLDAFLPKPDRDSGSADAFWHLMIFLSLGFQVTFIPAYEDLRETSYVDALRRRGVRVRVADETHDMFETLIEEAADAAIVMLSRFPVADGIAEPLRSIHPNVKIIFNTVDLHFLRETRAAQLAKDTKALAEAAETKRKEIDIMRACDATLVVSPAERDLLMDEGLEGRVHHIPIPRLPQRQEIAFRKRSGIVFIGSFDHQPNRDAVAYLLDEIWPLVRRKRTDVQLRIVGSNVTPELRRRHDPAAGVDIVGYVEDLEPVLASARVSVAPLRYGAGVKGKVVTSLMHGVPCVLTSIASEGLGLRDGDDSLIADTPAALADALLRLHDDEELWRRLAANGFAAVNEHHDINRVRQHFLRLLVSLGVPIPAAGGTGFQASGEFHPDLEIAVALAP